MIIIDFQNKCPKYKKKAITAAAWFAFNTLMPQTQKPIFINIRTIRNLAEKKGIYGDVMDEGDREFTIRIDVSLPLDDLISTMLHEMIHVWQYVTRRMVSEWVHEVRFNKKVYSSDMPYDERPWEVQAHQKEKELKEKYDVESNKRRTYIKRN
jgi:hypothetical protein